MELSQDKNFHWLPHSEQAEPRATGNDNGNDSMMMRMTDEGQWLTREMFSFSILGSFLIAGKAQKNFSPLFPGSKVGKSWSKISSAVTRIVIVPLFPFFLFLVSAF